ncbi:MAG TPA: DUF5947 family protein [Bryobacteraceae bacterium]|nr:DUF5947 family protein [Bryobacteraceae bacterium]
MSATSSNVKEVLEALRGFSRRREGGERCELCGVALGADHSHLWQRSGRRILCACDACAVLFTHREEGRNLIRIPRDARRLDSFRMDDAAWSALHLPIDLAFFVESSAEGHVIAYYPSPAGCTESLLHLDSWKEILGRNPMLLQMQADVEALLVDRTRGHRRYFLAPIDQCYKLTGIIRTEWQGFSGGDAVWREVDRFFESLAERAYA